MNGSLLFRLHTRHRLNQCVYTLERFDSPHKEHHTIIRLQPYIELGIIRRDRIKVTHVHAGWNNNQLALICFIEKTQLSEFSNRSDDNPVGATKDFLLTIDPILALAFHLRTRNAVLHLTQRVEHMDNWSSAPQIRKGLGRETRQPIVTVDEVILDSFFAGKGFDPLYKFGYVIDQLLFWDRMLRPGRNMDHPITVTQLMQNMRHMVILRAREHIHLNLFHLRLPADRCDRKSWLYVVLYFPPRIRRHVTQKTCLFMLLQAEQPLCRTRKCFYVLFPCGFMGFPL